MDQISKFGISDQDIKSLIESIFEKKDDLQGEIVGCSDPAEGCSGLIVFIAAEGNQNNQNKKINFVLKHSSINLEQREGMPVELMYRAEIYIYEKLLPILQGFLKKKNMPQLDMFSEFYQAKFFVDKEMLVLENLKIKGYKMNSIQSPLTLDQMKVLLKQYARWHSTCIAFKTENMDVWKENMTYLNDTKRYMYDKLGSPGAEVFRGFRDVICNILKENNENELLEKINKLDFIKLKQSSVIDDQYTVIVHEDCWNNNYLFKYKDESNIPDTAVILDWQSGSLYYLEADIATVLFTCLSTESLKNIEELLNFYYEEFSQNLLKLGHFTKEVYPKKLFISNWKKHAKFGIIAIPYIYTKAATAGNEGVGNSLDENESFFDMFDCKLNNKGVNERIINLLKYLNENELL